MLLHGGAVTSITIMGDKDNILDFLNLLGGKQESSNTIDVF